MFNVGGSVSLPWLSIQLVRMHWLENMLGLHLAVKYGIKLF